MHSRNSLADGRGQVYFAARGCLAFVLGLAFVAPVSAEQLIRLRNGVVLRGFVIEVASLNQNPFAAGGGNGEVQARPVWMVDDGLRRVYIHKLGMVSGAPGEVADLQQTITLWQPEPLGGKEVQGLGELIAVSPFNEYGRRVVTVRGPEGDPLAIVQGITEINARYAKLQGLKSSPSYIWDMRLATSALDSDTLRRTFSRRLDMNDLDARLEVVRFFIETERHADAKQALIETIRDFPDEKRLEAQIASITERQATQLLKEARLRGDAGQPKLATRILEGFPLTEVGRITRLEVQDLLEKERTARKQITEVISLLRDQVAKLGEERAGQVGPLVEEIAAELSVGTLPRLSDYVRLGQAEQIPLDSRVALALCGWMLGSGSGEQNFAIAASLIDVRAKVREYLAVNDPVRHEAILRELQNIEGAVPEYVSRILAVMVPPLELPEDGADETVPGLYRVNIESPDEPALRYVIQLPPEYDPQRSYPCVVALAPPGAEVESQIEWWSGPFDDKVQSRLGLASRHGYIVIAPEWTRPSQRLYEFTPREHASVLKSLRDAMRRAQIDSDRVFLAGHGEGATAAWDVALSHPDLWAGMISVGGEPRKTITHYHPNAKYVPLYLLMGERDGTPAPLIRNGPTMDNYMGMGFNTMVVMYRGRGREYFYEDMPHIFDWMNSPIQRRPAPPKSIETATMRSGDRFFWWLEMSPIKEPVAINPVLWDQAERLRAGKVSASVGADNQIRIGQGPSESFTVWMTPEMGIDLAKRVTVRYRSRRVDLDFQGDLAVMLEDARTRADRKHPFWAKVSVP